MQIKRHYISNFWLADSTHFPFITKKLKVKKAEEFALNIRKKVRFYRQNLHVLCNNNVIIHQMKLKYLKFITTTISSFHLRFKI